MLDGDGGTTNNPGFSGEGDDDGDGSNLGESLAALNPLLEQHVNLASRVMFAQGSLALFQFNDDDVDMDGKGKRSITAAEMDQVRISFSNVKIFNFQTWRPNQYPIFLNSNPNDTLQLLIISNLYYTQHSGCTRQEERVETCTLSSNKVWNPQPCFSQ